MYARESIRIVVLKLLSAVIVLLELIDKRRYGK